MKENEWSNICDLTDVNRWEQPQRIVSLWSSADRVHLQNKGIEFQDIMSHTYDWWFPINPTYLLIVLFTEQILSYILSKVMMNFHNIKVE